MAVVFTPYLGVKLLLDIKKVEGGHEAIYAARNCTWFVTLLDSALGCEAQSTLPAGRSYTTAEISANIVRPASHKTGPLRAIGRLIHGGGRLAMAEARIEDEEGKLYAHATTICLVFDVQTIGS